MKKLLCIVLALMLVLSLAACGGAGLGSDLGGTGLGGNQGGNEPASKVGKYYIVSLEMDGQTLDRAGIAENLGVDLENLDSVLCLEITAEGKAILEMGGTNQMSYDATSIWPDEFPDEKASFSLSNGTAVIDPGEYVMTFRK